MPDKQGETDDNVFFVNGDLYQNRNGGEDSNHSTLKSPEECKETRQLLSRLSSAEQEDNFYGRSRSRGMNSMHGDGVVKGMCNNTTTTNSGSSNNKNIEVGSGMERRRTVSTRSNNSTCSVNSTRFKRLVSKDGIVDIKYINVPGINKRYLTDIFHTLIDAKWRYISVLFTLSFIVSWLIFGTSWYVIVKVNNTKDKCIANVDDWTSAFLFSIETQTTIGFGGRAVTASCPEGVLLLVIQTIVGMFINCAMLGLLFVKLSRPKNRGKATLFSSRAVITIREGAYCLIFRYVDFRPRRLLDSNMRLVMVRQKLTDEGEFVPLDMADMKVTLDFMQNEYTLRLFPLFPLTIIHEIDDTSPLYKMSKLQLRNTEFEIIAILEGTVPTTGSTTQALTSYKPDEILWGHRFKPVLNGFNIGHSINRIDLSTIHDTVEEKHVPPCSAEEYMTNNNTNDDSSSCSGSHGYQSGTRSFYSIDHVELTNTKVAEKEGYDVVITIDPGDRKLVNMTAKTSEPEA